MSTRKVTLTADTTRYQEALERLEALAAYDREQRRPRSLEELGITTDVTVEALETRHAIGRIWPKVPEMGGLLAETASAQVRQIAACMSLEEDEVRKALLATVAAFDPVATWQPTTVVPVRPIEHVLADIVKEAMT